MCMKNYGQRSVQEVVNKTIPEKRKEKAMWSPEVALQIVEEGREVKSKGERESYIQLNPELQKITRRDRKGFFDEQSLIIEENNKGERLESSLGKLETSWEHSAERSAQ